MQLAQLPRVDQLLSFAVESSKNERNFFYDCWLLSLLLQHFSLLEKCVTALSALYTVPPPPLLKEGSPSNTTGCLPPHLRYRISKVIYQFSTDFLSAHVPRNELDHNPDTPDHELDIPPSHTSDELDHEPDSPDHELARASLLARVTSWTTRQVVSTTSWEVHILARSMGWTMS
jgi:hypothetical protein